MIPAIAFAFWCMATPTTTPPHTSAALERVKVKLVFPAMSAAAMKYINLPMGSERYATVNGKHYVFVLEHHYHPPGFVGGPVGDHKGVTMYELR
jgi:hypothetical protein